MPQSCQPFASFPHSLCQGSLSTGRGKCQFYLCLTKEAWEMLRQTKRLFTKMLKRRNNCWMTTLTKTFFFCLNFYFLVYSMTKTNLRLNTITFRHHSERSWFNSLSSKICNLFSVKRRIGLYFRSSCVLTKSPTLSGTPAESVKMILPMHPSSILHPLPPDIQILANYFDSINTDISIKTSLFTFLFLPLDIIVYPFGI